jgi:glyoxylase-like metal-dependent hydrolase (beta-lactamase superfamily II)
MNNPPKILDHLWQVGGGGLSGPGDAAVYLVRFGDTAALIDAGCGDGHEAVKTNIAACLPEKAAITHLFLTHCHFDHTGGADRLRAEYGAKIVAHELDAVYLETGDSQVTAATWYGERLAAFPVDIKIDGSEQTFDIGDGRITALHCPGHSPGSMVLTTRMDGLTVLFGQDVHGPIHPALLSDHDNYQTSLRRLLDMEADVLLEGHYGVIEGKKAVRDFIRSFIEP